MEARTLLVRLVASELRAFRCEAPLARVFWVQGVAASSWLIALSMVVVNQGTRTLVQALILVNLAYTAWILVAIWRCASNAQPWWATLARWLTVAWGLNTLFILFFVEVELVLGHAPG